MNMSKFRTALAFAGLAILAAFSGSIAGHNWSIVISFTIIVSIMYAFWFMIHWPDFRFRRPNESLSELNYRLGRELEILMVVAISPVYPPIADDKLLGPLLNTVQFHAVEVELSCGHTAILYTRQRFDGNKSFWCAEHRVLGPTRTVTARKSRSSGELPQILITDDF
jgi:uncharacterized protein (DUF58 family)